MSRLRQTATALALALLATLLAWALSTTTALETLEGRSTDWRFQFRGPVGERSREVVVVLIEDEADLPYWSPVPRSHLAAVIEQLSEARLIGLDIFLDEPSFDAEGDARLRRALESHGGVIAVSYLEGGVEQLPHPEFRKSLLDYGYATFPVGTDEEVVRRGTVYLDLPAGRSLSLAGCMYLHDLGVDVAAVRDGADPGVEQRHLINYTGPPAAAWREGEYVAGGFAVCPSHMVAAGVYPAAFFEGKHVLIGSGLMDAPDQFRIPFFSSKYGYRKAFGVEIHAHFLQTLLSGSTAGRLSPAWSWTLAALLAWAAALAVILGGAAWSVPAAVGLLVLWWVGGFMAFSRWDAVTLLMGPSLAVGLSFAATQVHYALTEGKERRRTRTLFEKYLSPDVIAELMADSDHWQLGGRRMEITVMFADLQGFTPMCEQLQPEELVRLMNEYLSEMTALILAEGGTIDKYEGDLIMAFFGAPLPQGDHATRACRAATRMQARMQELREQWRGRGLPELHVRIGLNSGSAVVGNMGSGFRFNYTAMGPVVNVASRLEGANKDFGTYTLVSLATRLLVKSGGFTFRNRGTTMVKGVSEPIQVYELETASAYTTPQSGPPGEI